MIKSRHNTFGFWLLAGAMAVFVFLTVCCITKFYFDFTIVEIHIRNQRSFNGWMAITGIALLAFGSILSSRVSSIEIHYENGHTKTIKFKNLFTGRAKTYFFEEFDGYIRTKLWHKQFNENKTLCLIKGGRVIRKIDNFFYSNFGELENGLKDMKYLGYKRMGF